MLTLSKTFPFYQKSKAYVDSKALLLLLKRLPDEIHYNWHRTMFSVFKQSEICSSEKIFHSRTYIKHNLILKNIVLDALVLLPHTVAEISGDWNWIVKR